MGTQRWKEAAGTLLSFSFPEGASCCPGSALLCATTRHGEGPECRGSTPRRCALTMPPWLAVPEVPTAEVAAPMAPLPVSLL